MDPIPHLECGIWNAANDNAVSVMQNHNAGGSQMTNSGNINGQKIS